MGGKGQSSHAPTTGHPPVQGLQAPSCAHPPQDLPRSQVSPQRKPGASLSPGERQVSEVQVLPANWKDSGHSMAEVTRARARFPHTVLKSKESAISQEEEGEGQEKQSFPLQEGGRVTAVRPGCAQARVEGCPTLDRGVCAPRSLSSGTRQKPCLQYGTAPTIAPSPPRPRGQCTVRLPNFVSPCTGVLGIQGAGCGGPVMQRRLKTFQAPSSDGPRASHNYTKERTAHI